MAFGNTFFDQTTVPATISGRAATHMQSAYQTDAPNLAHKAGRMTFIFRVISRTTGNILKEHRLLCMPTDYTVTPESRSQVQYTAGGVYFDKIGLLGLDRHSIRGHTTYRGQTLSNGTRIDGMAAYRDLRDTIDFYFTGKSAKPVIANHDPDDLFLTFVDETWAVTREQPAPPEWVIHTDRQRVGLTRRSDKPFIYHYSLEFVAFERDIRSEVAATETLDLRPRPRTILQQLQRIAREIASLDSLESLIMSGLLGSQGLDILQQGRNYRSLIFSTIDLVQNFVGGTQSLIDSAFERVNSVIAAGESLRDSILSIVDLAWGGRITGEHAYLLNEVRHVERRMNRLLLVEEFFGSASQSRIRNFLEVRNLTSSLGRGTSVTAEAAGLTSIATRQGLDLTELLRFDSLMEYPLEEGDTIDSLAARLGISPDILAELNNLRFPFVDTTDTRPVTDPEDSLGRNVLYRGDGILLPVVQQVENAALNLILVAADIISGTEGREFSLEEQLFGSDLAMDSDGDLVVNPATRDLHVLAGRNNLLQSYDIAFRLRIGQLHHHPAYGNYLKEELGSYLTRPSRELAALATWKTLFLNPRTASVTRIEAKAQAGRMDVDWDLKAIGGIQIAQQELASAGGG